MRRIALFLPALLLTGLPATLAAQFPGCETYITIVAAPASAHYQSTGDITVEYGEIEEECLGYGPPDPATFKFYVDGVDRTSYFSAGTYQAVGYGVPLCSGAGCDNATITLIANITGHDEDDNPRLDADTTTVLVDVSPAPNITMAPHNFDNQDYGRCASACFAMTTSYTTTPYYSLDTPRSVTLVYNSDRAFPRPFVHVDVRRPSGANTPERFKLQVWYTDPYVSTYLTFTNGETALYFDGTADSVRLGGQFDAVANNMGNTGVYEITVEVTAEYPGSEGSGTSVSNTRVMVVNEWGAAAGTGWTIAGWQQLYPLNGGHVLITDGTGSAVFFEKPCGTCSLASPLGEFSRVTDTGPAYAQYVRTYPDSTQVTFNSSGRMTEITDRFGNTTKFWYDGSGRPWKIQDPSHTQSSPREIVLAYNASGLDYIQDPFGRTTQVSAWTHSSGARRITWIYDLDGVGTRYWYDSSSRLQKIDDRLGARTVVAYDAAWKLKSVTAPAIPVYGGGATSPVTTLDDWQSVGVPYASTSSTPATPVQPDTIRARVTDPDGHVTMFTVNRFGQPLRTDIPLNQWTSVTYNGNGQPVAMSNSGGASALWTYDGSGFPTTVTANGETTQLRNGGWGQADSIVGPDSLVVQRLFLNASNGRVDSIRLGGDTLIVSNFFYDQYGRVTLAHDPEGHVSSKTDYTGTNGNRSRDSLPGNRVTTYGYDSYGRRTSVTAPTQPTRTVTLDALNRVTHAYDGVHGIATRFHWGPLQLDSVVDLQGQTYGYRYNALGWTVATVDPTNRADSTFYTVAGDVAAWKNRRGEQISYTYDALHRRYGRTGSNIIADTIAFSDDGRQILVSNYLARDSVFVNVRGQLDSTVTVYTGAASQRVVRRYTYGVGNMLGTVTTVGTNGAPASFADRIYSRDPGTGRLAFMTFGDQTTSLGLNADGQRTSLQLPGASNTVTRDYTTIHDLSRQLGPTGTGSAVDRYIETDVLGRTTIQWGENQVSGQVFGYDDLGRMAADTFVTNVETCDYDPEYGWVCGGSLQVDSVRTFPYDSVGNRTPGIYGTGNRIESFGGCSYTTDLDGNVTSRTGCSGLADAEFQWFADNRLKTLIVGTDTTFLRHDAYGRLLVHWGAPSWTNWYVWDGDHVQAILDGGFNIRAEYAYWPGSMDRLYAIQASDGRQHYAHSDALGNVIALTDSNRVVTRTYQYDEWGRLEGGTDPGGLADRDRARFKGALWLDHPGIDMYFMRNRWYEARSGRFLSEDPIGLEGGINQFAFAANDPINGRDPTGLNVCFDLGQGQELVDSLRRALEEATNTKIKLDEDGCVVSATPRDGNLNYQELQAYLHALVSDPKMVLVRFQEPRLGFSAETWTKSEAWFGDPWTIRIGWNSRQRYHTYRSIRVPWLGCIGQTVRGSLAAHMAHELLGHAGGRVRPNTDNNGGVGNRGANYVQNLYHAAVGEPTRRIGC